MEKREGSAAQIDQNPEELAGSIQGCKLAVARSGGGEPHSKTASTSKLNLGLGNDYNFLKLPDGAELRFCSVYWAGGFGRCHATRGAENFF